MHFPPIKQRSSANNIQFSELRVTFCPPSVTWTFHEFSFINGPAKATSDDGGGKRVVPFSKVEGLPQWCPYIAVGITFETRNWSEAAWILEVHLARGGLELCQTGLDSRRHMALMSQHCVLLYERSIKVSATNLHQSSCFKNVTDWTLNILKLDSVSFYHLKLWILYLLFLNHRL